MASPLKFPLYISPRKSFLYLCKESAFPFQILQLSGDSGTDPVQLPLGKLLRRVQPLLLDPDAAALNEAEQAQPIGTANDLPLPDITVGLNEISNLPDLILCHAVPPLSPVHAQQEHEERHINCGTYKHKSIHCFSSCVRTFVLFDTGILSQNQGDKCHN